MLLKWEGGALVIQPEMMAIKAFKRIWEADKSVEKGKAIDWLSLLYFMFDPRSDYMAEVDEGERLSIVTRDLGLSVDVVKEKWWKDAVETYRYLTTTTSSLMLENNRKILKKVVGYLDAVDVNGENVIDILRAVKDQTTLSVDISRAERSISADVEERVMKSRGGGRRSILDDGLDLVVDKEVNS
jgi:hypothetical protein